MNNFTCGSKKNIMLCFTVPESDKKTIKKMTYRNSPRWPLSFRVSRSLVPRSTRHVTFCQACGFTTGGRSNIRLGAVALKTLGASWLSSGFMFNALARLWTPTPRETGLSGQGEFVTPAKLPNHHMAIEDQTPAISVHFAAFSNTDIHIFPPVLRSITPLTSCSFVSFCTKIRLGRFPC